MMDDYEVATGTSIQPIASLYNERINESLYFFAVSVKPSKLCQLVLVLGTLIQYKQYSLAQ